MKTREELKLYAQTILDTLKPYLTEVTGIANKLHSQATSTSFGAYVEYENKLVGIYTFLVPQYKELDAMTENYEAVYYNQLKVKSEIDRTKFVSEVAVQAATEYTEDLRLATKLLEGWVETIEQLIQTCRNHSYINRKESKYA